MQIRDYGYRLGRSWRVRGRPWFVVSLGLAGVAALAAGAPARAGRAAPSALAQSRERAEGQWIWTARDRALFEEARTSSPSLRAAVLIASIECVAGELKTKLGLSPLTAGSAPDALVVRLSDSVHGCFDRQPDEQLEQSLDVELGRLLQAVRDSRASFSELQLDYDAPTEKLARYASVLRYLHAHSLRGVDLWVTSLPVHVEQPSYGSLMQGAVSGHILQLFDTGLSCDTARAEQLRAALRTQALPYRIGYGAFERKGAPASRAHACWIGLTRAWQADPGASGWWIFPAGIRYRQSVELLRGAP